MPYSATSAAATSSFVESGFEAASTTSAPPALSVRIRFAVSVVTWRHAPMRRPVERPLALEALADEAQDGHLALGPLDAPDALGGEAEVGHVVGGQGGAWRSVIGRSVSLRVKRRRSGAVRSGHGEPRRWTRRSSNRTCSA